VFAGFWLRDEASARQWASRVLVAIPIALLVMIGGLLWIHLWPDSIRADLRSDFSSWRYWWRHPFVAAGLTLALLSIAGWLHRSTAAGRRRLPTRIGALAAGTWLVLAVMLWASAWAGERARRDYERALRAASADPVGALLGPEADGGLRELRRWQP
jgi:hypothetical protein